MTVTDYLAKKLNTIKVDSDVIIELKQYYLSMYRYYCLLLFDKNYISDPTRYNEKEIRKNIIELGIKGSTSYAGGMKINSNQIKYCMLLNKEPQQQEFLKLVHSMLLYREYSIAIDTFYEIYGVGTIKLKLKNIRGYIGVNSGLHFNKAIARVISNRDSETIRKHSVAPYIRLMALSELGLNLDEGQLDPRLSIEQEENLVELLFGESPPSSLKGKGAELLYNWYKNNSGKQKSLIAYVVYQNYYEFMEKMNELCKEIESKGEEIILIEGINIYTRCKRKSDNYPVGYFTIIGGDDDEVIDQIVKNGYTGEGYTEDYLRSEGFNFIGVPIKIYKDNKEIYLYDVEQTSVSYDSYFKSTGVDFMFEENSIINEPKNHEEAIQNSLSGFLGKINLEKEY